MNRNEKIERAFVALEAVVSRPVETSIVDVGFTARRFHVYESFVEQVADLMADLMLLVEYRTPPVDGYARKALERASEKFEADKMFDRAGREAVEEVPS